jgi:serine protease inhibitor
MVGIFILKEYSVIFIVKLYTMNGYRIGEFGSRLSSTRDFFGVKANGKITKNQIINYIKSNKNDIEVDFVLGRWVVMDFPPIENFLNDINSFVMSDFNTTTKNSIS